MRRALLSGLAATITMTLLFGLFNLAGRARAQEEKKADQKQAAPTAPQPSPEALKALDASRKAYAQARDQLEKDGVYNCCIKPGCAFCGLTMGRCPCAANLAQNKGVCPECWGGWHADQGALPGQQTRDKDNQLLLDGRLIRVTTLSALKAMYDARAKQLPAETAPPAAEKPAEKPAPKPEPPPKEPKETKAKSEAKPKDAGSPPKPAPKKDAPAKP